MHYCEGNPIKNTRHFSIVWSAQKGSYLMNDPCPKKSFLLEESVRQRPQFATGAILFYRPTHPWNDLQSVPGPLNSANNSSFQRVTLDAHQDVSSSYSPPKNNKQKTLPILTQPPDHKIEVEILSFLLNMKSPKVWKVSHSAESVSVYIQELPFMEQSGNPSPEKGGRSFEKILPSLRQHSETHRIHVKQQQHLGIPNKIAWFVQWCM